MNSLTYFHLSGISTVCVLVPAAKDLRLSALTLDIYYLFNVSDNFSLLCSQQDPFTLVILSLKKKKKKILQVHFLNFLKSLELNIFLKISNLLGICLQMHIPEKLSFTLSNPIFIQLNVKEIFLDNYRK